MNKDKQEELFNDAKAECGCYKIGDWCYDKWGDTTHSAKEECNE